MTGKICCPKPQWEGSMQAVGTATITAVEQQLFSNPVPRQNPTMNV